MRRTSSEGSDASGDEAVRELRTRLAQVRSFIWWTVPLYVIFVAVGAYASRLTLSVQLGVLLAVLVAFGGLDGLVLLRLRAIEQDGFANPDGLPATRAQLERLARVLLRAGLAFGATFVAAVAILLVLP